MPNNDDDFFELLSYTSPGVSISTMSPRWMLVDGPTLLRPESEFRRFVNWAKGLRNNRFSHTNLWFFEQLKEFSKGDFARATRFVYWLNREQIAECVECGTWLPDRFVEFGTGMPTLGVCPSCASDYEWSERAQSFIHSNDWDEDLHANRPSPIHDYSYNVLDMYNEFIAAPGERWNEETMFMGIELEVERPSEFNVENEIGLDNLLGENKFGILKYDGSLDNGFELVTVPATFAYHTGPASPWPELLKHMRDQGLRSFDTTTCGLHVHVSKAAISHLTQGKLVEFVNSQHNRAFIQSIAQRRLEGGHSYAPLKEEHDLMWGWRHRDDIVVRKTSRPELTCDCDACRSEHRDRLRRYEAIMAELQPSNVRKVRSKKLYTFDWDHDERYSSINLTNAETVEFRIFKGTLSQNGLYRYLEFVHSILSYLPQVGITELGHEDFCKWVARKGRKSYPHLLRWMQVKGHLPAPRHIPPDRVTLERNQLCA